MDSTGDMPHLRPGEARGDLIGCYLLYVGPAPGEEPSYHSLASTKPDLIRDCWELFGRLRSMKMETLAAPFQPPPGLPPELAQFAEPEFRRRHSADLAQVNGLLANLEYRVDQHLATDGNAPFFALPGLVVFLNLGARARQKVRGEYIE